MFLCKIRKKSEKEVCKIRLRSLDLLRHQFQVNINLTTDHKANQSTIKGYKFIQIQKFSLKHQVEELQITLHLGLKNLFRGLLTPLFTQQDVEQKLREMRQLFMGKF